ncbi:unnamed protein product [Hermetia illucens]|uniref:EF-hand domain-containing protein n=1 Tax=Hermetia illucens TaxID=343691 RepID=A0A7R8V5X8_HERIL|nr:unnamed protein product [Hermetia illucens]
MTSIALDPTMDDAQNSKFRNTYHNLVMNFARKKVFSERETECLLLAYHKFVLKNGRKMKLMTRRQFGNLFHNMFNVLDPNFTDAIFSAADPSSKKFITPEAFLDVMSVVLRGTLEQQIELCFKVYDPHGNGYITRERLRKFYRNMFDGAQDEVDELTNDFVETIFRKMDIDRDGKISFDDYAQTVRKNPCLLQFVGTCLPDSGTIFIFSQVYKT